MRIEELRQLLRANPFRPFTVYTADGSAVPVWYPDFALLSPDGRTLWVYQRDYSCDLLDVMLIPRFSLGPPPATAEGTSPAGTP